MVLILNLSPSGLVADPSVTPADGQAGKSYEFVNGRWFDGKSFRRHTFYSVNAILTDEKPRTVDEVVDLKDGYVVPLFADAHCHHFDAPYNVGQQVEMYLRDGVLYAAVQGNSRSGARRVPDKVNTPTRNFNEFKSRSLDLDKLVRSPCFLDIRRHFRPAVH